jgi:hypothetical protein
MEKKTLIILGIISVVIVAYLWYKYHYEPYSDTQCSVVNGKLQTADGRLCATTTRYWDCSRPTASWNPNCGTGGPITKTNNCANYSGADDGIHNSPYNAPSTDGKTVFTTSAASGSFGLTQSGGKPCGKCYELEITGQCGNPYDNSQYACDNAKNVSMKGTKFITMVTNLCPDWQSSGGNAGKGCPPSSNDLNIRGANHHFDVALVGGGFGAQGKCPTNYSWSPKNVQDCSNTSIVPSQYKSACEIFYNQLGQIDNPMVAFKEVPCPNTPNYNLLNTGKS